MQNLFYRIERGTWAAAKGSLVAVASRLIKYPERQNVLQTITCSAADPLPSHCTTRIFPKTKLTPFPIRQGMAEITSQAWVCISVSFFLISSPFACASRAAHTLEGSRQPRCLLRLSAHTTPVGAQIRAQPERRHLGFCKTSHISSSPFTVGVWTCNSEIASSHQFFGNLNATFRKT